MVRCIFRLVEGKARGGVMASKESKYENEKYDKQRKDLTDPLLEIKQRNNLKQWKVSVKMGKK